MTMLPASRKRRRLSLDPEHIALLPLVKLAPQIEQMRHEGSGEKNRDPLPACAG